MRRTKHLTAIAAILTVVGCAHIAKDYLIRHYASEAVLILARYKLAALEYYQVTGRLATSNDELHMPAPQEFQSNSITALRVLPNGALAATLQPASGYRAAEIIFVPNLSNRHIGLEWSCVSPEIKDIDLWLTPCRYDGPPERRKPNNDVERS